MQVKEIKQRLNGTRQTFFCDALHLSADVAVLRFLATADYSTDPSTERPHRYTDGFFWPGRSYLMYQMFGDNDELLGYRFDVCTDVTVDSDTVRWTDLELDFWVDPALTGGEFLDEAEYADAVQRELVTPEQQELVEKTRGLLATRFRDIIGEAQALRAEVGAGKL